MKEYTFEIDIKICSLGLQAENDNHAIQQLKDIFLEDNNINLEDDEIKIIEVKEVN